MAKGDKKKVSTGISVPREVLDIIAAFGEEQLISYQSAALSALVLEWQKIKVMLDEFAGDRPVRDRLALLAQLLAEWKAAYAQKSITPPIETN